MRGMKVYISGPVTGMPDNNKAAFEAVEKELRSLPGVKTVNPLRIAEEVRRGARFEPEWEDYMRDCIRELCRATHITFLPGWENSKGARLEKQIADALGIKELQGEA
jgi:hypothetical protein